MRRTFLCLILGVSLLWAGIAFAAPPQLKGEYAFTGEMTCFTSLQGFDENLDAQGISFLQSYTVQGVWTFNGDGTGSREGRSVGLAGAIPALNLPPSANSEDFQASFRYTLGPDGTFTTELTSPLTGTVLTGRRAGQTFTIDQIRLTGIISKDKKTLTVATEEPEIETLTYSNGNVHKRICHRSRVLIWLGE
jgi:hypothetical protein